MLMIVEKQYRFFVWIIDAGFNPDFCTTIELYLVRLFDKDHTDLSEVYKKKGN